MASLIGHAVELEVSLKNARLLVNAIQGVAEALKQGVGPVQVPSGVFKVGEEAVSSQLVEEANG